VSALGLRGRSIRMGRRRRRRNEKVKEGMELEPQLHKTRQIKMIVEYFAYYNWFISPCNYGRRYTSKRLFKSFVVGIEDL
jgi:hypothetical protein